MGQMVITVIGDDRAGLVDAVSGAVARCGGNWERSHMAELAGKFAGIVLVRIPEDGFEGLTAELDAIESQGLLHISVERAGADDPGATAASSTASSGRLEMNVTAQDHTGIVHEISHALASLQVSIDELETEVAPAPMGGTVFRASAVLATPAQVSTDEVRDALEALSHDLMVDLDLVDS